MSRTVVRRVVLAAVLVVAGAAGLVRLVWEVEAAGMVALVAFLVALAAGESEPGCGEGCCVSCAPQDVEAGR
ncbi:hypothetical protein NI17_024080 (plasmid) [Thermobifida halotolerans]|uniref:Uncharacterized protein n=1 Tax=Thermobifida halotolerans TaxID=483545 RepID=A0A399FVD7_9ACTN|nr:hypothetical protein [Thermobifida halotolerans]UOE22293.1 hypothetical protein NI17_024080 [Thermobifida halotolerans]